MTIIKKHRVLLILIFAALLRLGYVLTLEDRWYFFDTVHYDTAAQSILQGEGFGPSLHFYANYGAYCLEPVYPLFLAFVYKIFGHSLLAVRIIQSLLSVLTVFVAYLLARQFSRRASMAVLIFGSIYPFYIYISGLLYVTQIAALLFVFALYAFVRYRQEPGSTWLFISGLAFGLAIVTKPVLMPAILLITLWMLFAIRDSWHKRLAHAAVLLLTIVACMTPWSIRNWIVFQKFAPGRACISQVRTLEYQKHLIDREVLAEKESFDVQRFAIKFEKESGKTSIVGVLDGDPFIRYTPIEDLGELQRGYAGLCIYGGDAAEIRGLRAWKEKADSLSLIFDTRAKVRAKTFGNAFVSPEAVRVRASEPGWRNKILFPEVRDVAKIEMEYPLPCPPGDARRFAFLVGLDSLKETASGYMIWLQPWLDIDIWRIENGKPLASVPTIKSFPDGSQTSIFALLMQYPVKFMINHYIPEFFRFWSPFVMRITSRENSPGKIQQLASPLFFIPILVLLPVGLFRLYRMDRAALFLFLIPIFTLSAGYSLFFAEIRFRIPIDAFLIILAMIGLDFILNKLEKNNVR